MEQYHAQCTTANIQTCVPVCNACCNVTTHGYELLATIDGTDTKFSCNLAHMLYSWMGAASEGGYLGADFASFFASVVSGAAGAYFLTLMMNVGIHTDLTIQPGQNVHIAGDPALTELPIWGAGGFVLSEMGVLSLTHLAVTGRMTLQPGSTALTISGCFIGNGVFASGLTVPSGAEVAIIGGTDAVTFGVPVAVQDSATLRMEGPLQLANADLLSLAASPAFNLGTVSLDGVIVALADGTLPTVTGTLPGTVSAALGGQNVHTASSAGGWIPSIVAVWNGGSVTNYAGNTFSLYRMSADPTCCGDARGITTAGDAAAYKSLCASAGLLTVGQGYRDCANACLAWGGCMPLPPGDPHCCDTSLNQWGENAQGPRAGACRCCR